MVVPFPIAGNILEFQNMWVFQQYKISHPHGTSFGWTPWYTATVLPAAANTKPPPTKTTHHRLEHQCNPFVLPPFPTGEGFEHYIMEQPATSCVPEQKC